MRWSIADIQRAREPLPEDLSRNMFAVDFTWNALLSAWNWRAIFALSSPRWSFRNTKKRMEMWSCTGKTMTCHAMVHVLHVNESMLHMTEGTALEP